MKPTFSLRTALGLILLAALSLGWYSSSTRYQQQLKVLHAQLEYERHETSRLANQVQGDQRRIARNDRDLKRLFYLADLDGMSLRSAVIQSGNSAFQGTSFIESDLRDVTLKGDTSAFQGARFDRAKLAGAKLTGGLLAFQNASFTAADLKGAVLAGGDLSFQLASFEVADLTGATIDAPRGAFQTVNVDSVKFQSADLSSLDAQSLESCYFRYAPQYDEKTKFPPGFDPTAAGWKRVN